MPKILITLISLFIIGTAKANTLQEMQSEIDSEQYARAATTGLALLRQQPDNLRLQFLTALAFQKNNQPKQAIRYYQEIINTHPELPEPRNNLAIIYLQQGAYDEAVQLLIASLNTRPAYATAYKNLNSIYQGLASEAYQKALNDDMPPVNFLSNIKLTELDKLQLPEIVDSKPVPVVQPVQIVKADKEAGVPVSVVPTVQPGIQTAVAKPVARKEPDKEQLIQLVKNWANAWSSQEFDQYISAYRDSYKGQYSNHDEWVKQRRERVVRVDHIELTLSNFKVKLNSENQAIIDFHQAYQSPSYHDKVVKRLQLDRINNTWKISREVTLAVL
jgi:tetratricopeptide (TPR) repeat protein